MRIDNYNKLYERKFAIDEPPSSIFPIKLNGQKNNGIGVFCEKAQKAYLLNGDRVSYPNFSAHSYHAFYRLRFVWQRRKYTHSGRHWQQRFCL